MLTRFKRSTDVVFLDPQSSETIVTQNGKKLEIVLSPKMYWVKKMSLPVSSVREVNKLLPSIFEDSLPAGFYSYYAYKNKEEFILFAYEDKKILSLIASKGISTTDIASIRFAQTEFSDLEGAVNINTKESMYIKDTLLILAPSIWVEDAVDLDLSKIKHSKHTIKLQQFGHIVDKKSLYTVGGVLVSLALILLIEQDIRVSMRLLRSFS